MSDVSKYCPYGFHAQGERYCLICRTRGFDHEERDCPNRCPCGGYHVREAHFCMICHARGFDHEERICPKMCPCGGFHIQEYHNFEDYYKSLFG